jgi:hypothetical protein
MHESDPLLARHLADYRFHRLQISCASCGRHGDYSVATLRKLYGNPPMADVPRFVAMRGNCALAMRFPTRIAMHALPIVLRPERWSISVWPITPAGP